MTPRKFVAIIATATLLPFGFVVGAASASDARQPASSARIVDSRCLYDDDTDVTRTVTKIINRGNHDKIYYYVARERRAGYMKELYNLTIKSGDSRRVPVRHEHRVRITVSQERNGEIVLSTPVKARDCS